MVIAFFILLHMRISENKLEITTINKSRLLSRQELFSNHILLVYMYVYVKFIVYPEYTKIIFLI